MERNRDRTHRCNHPGQGKSAAQMAHGRHVDCRYVRRVLNFWPYLVYTRKPYTLEMEFLAIFGFWGGLLAASHLRNVVDFCQALAAPDTRHNVCRPVSFNRIPLPGRGFPGNRTLEKTIRTPEIESTSRSLAADT